MKKKRILIAFGTRPEALKFVPLIRALRASKDFDCSICLTGQHREMLNQVVRFFNIKIDSDLKLMRTNQSLEYVSGRVISKFGKIIRRFRPDLVFVQGDTATALMVAIVSFYLRVPIAHLEAGLRTRNKFHPFPEEMNRTIITHLADFHFTPTDLATANLKQEGISKKVIFQVGNTVVDTVRIARPLVKKNYSILKYLDRSKKLLFVTAHRRESFGKGLKEIFLALKMIVRAFNDVEVVYPVHLNPHVIYPARQILGKIDRIHLVRPLTYEETCWMMENCFAILTDSGGIQEEAPSFKKPVLVLRNITERPEGVKAGIARIVGTDKHRIFNTASKLLSSKGFYQKMVAKKNPYGDGYSADHIVVKLRTTFSHAFN